MTRYWLNNFAIDDYIKQNIGKKVSFAIVNDGIPTDTNHLQFHSTNIATYEPQLVIS